MSLGSISSPNKKRDFRFDNLRGVAIFFVVFAHFLGTTRVSGFGFIHESMNVFVIMLLFFVSGYFSKPNYDTIIKSFKNILIPYLVFNTIYIIFLFILKGYTPSLPFIAPTLALWYLLSLFFMRSLLPVISKIKYIFWISLFIASIAVVFNSKSIENILVWYRTLYFLPSFLLGFYFPKIQSKIDGIDFSKELVTKLLILMLAIIFLVSGVFMYLTNPMPKFLSIAFILIAISIVSTIILIFYNYIKDKYNNIKGGYNNIETHSVLKKYGQRLIIGSIAILLITITTKLRLIEKTIDILRILSFTSIEASVFKFAIVILGLIIVILLYKIISDNENILTTLGKNSLAVYILHIFFTELAPIVIKKLGLKFIVTDVYLAGIYVLVCTIAVSYITSRDFITKYINLLLKHVNNLIFKKEFDL
jgi:fucose 4-O-acetylase-like acetyltransferase